MLGIPGGKQEFLDVQALQVPLGACGPNRGTQWEGTAFPALKYRSVLQHEEEAHLADPREFQPSTQKSGALVSVFHCFLWGISLPLWGIKCLVSALLLLS